MDLAASLISYWDLGEASGDALDAHGSNDLQDNGTVGSATGKVGNGRDFEASNSESFSIADNASLSFGDDPMTIAFWVKFESLGANQDCVAKDDQTNRDYLVGYDFTNNRIRFIVWDTATGGTATTLRANNFGAPSTGVWYFIVAKHDPTANELSLSVNGVADTVSYSAGIRDSGVQFRIGSRGNDTSFTDGIIDEVGIWDRVLSTAEEVALYNGGDGMSYASIVAGTDLLDDAVSSAVLHLKLDEASGNAIDAINARTFTDTATVGAAAGKFNGARDFEQTASEYFAGPDHADYEPADSKWMIRVWVQLESKGAERAIMAKFTGGAGFREWALVYEVSADRFMFIAQRADEVGNVAVNATNFGSPSTATWYLIHAWHDPDADVIGISVNGGTPNTAAISTGIYQGGSPLRIGSYDSGSTFMDGLLDDVVIFKNYLLSQTQRTMDYNLGDGIAFEDWDLGGGGGLSIPIAMRHYLQMMGAG